MSLASISEISRLAGVLICVLPCGKVPKIHSHDKAHFD